MFRKKFVWRSLLPQGMLQLGSPDWMIYFLSLDSWQLCTIYTTKVYIVVVKITENSTLRIILHKLHNGALSILASGSSASCTECSCHF